MELSGFGYICSGGETFDSVAAELYGDEQYAAELLCANPEQCHLARFAGGEMLYLPVVELPEEEEDEAAVPLNAPWKEE